MKTHSVNSRSNVAVLHVYYKEKTSFLYKTDIHYGIEDFICNKAWNLNYLTKCITHTFFEFWFPIAAVGGILSLGLGLSCVGVIELLYYLFFRCYVPVLSASQERSNENSMEDPLPLSYRSDKDNRSLTSSSNSPNSSTLNLSDSQLDEAVRKQENVKMVEISLD
jgi:hypothetical protein